MAKNAAVHKPLEPTSTLNRLPHLADSLLHFNLTDELHRLREEDSWTRGSGRSSKTLAKYPDFAENTRRPGRRLTCRRWPSPPSPSVPTRWCTWVAWGSLSTLSRKHPGFPFGSVMPYGLGDHRRPIFLVSTMAMHTQNLQANSHASLLVTQPDTEGEPLGASRVTLLGNVLPVPKPELAEARKVCLERHANSKYWVDFDDFSFYRMDIVDVYYVGGFGVMGWVSASDYGNSHADPLADSMAEIILHMNADHKDALVMLDRTICSHGLNGSVDDRSRSPRLSCPFENC